MQASCSKLDNGLTVVTDHIPEAHGASVHWVVRAGARHEEHPGTAHFFEHMLMYSNVGENGKTLADRLDEISPNSNAATGPEAISGHADVLPEFVPEVIEHFGSILTAPQWTDDTLEIQRALIINEHDEGEASAFRSALNVVRDKLYSGHPLSRKIVGNRADIEAMQNEHLRGYMRDHFRAGNIALVVSGPMPHDEVMALAEQHFPKIVAGKTPIAARPDTPIGGQSAYIVKPRDEQYITIAGHGVDLSTDDHMAGSRLTMLMKIGLNDFLRKAGHSYQGTDFCATLPYSDHGFTILNFDVAPDKAEASLRAVAEYVGSPERWLTEEKFSSSKLIGRAASAFNFLNPSDRASSIAFHYQSMGEIMPYADIDAQYASVDFASVVAAYEAFREIPKSVFGYGPCKSLPSPDEINALIRGEGPELQGPKLPIAATPNIPSRNGPLFISPNEPC